MVFLHAVALLAAVSTAPTPQQYYARALDTMNAIPQPAYATYDLSVRVSGAGMETDCHPKADAAFDVGWGKRMKHALELSGEYALGGNQAAIRDAQGNYCRDDVSIFKPAWAAMHDWMRYGLLGAPTPPAQQPDVAQTPNPAALRTIVSETAVAPAAYEVYDSGAAVCPDGSKGHALHLVARAKPDEHPLTDVIVQTQSARFCFMRFNLVNATIAGTGAKADTTIGFGMQNGYWAVTGAHLVLALRMLGVSMKHVSVDVAYSHMQYPAALPQPIPSLQKQ